MQPARVKNVHVRFTAECRLTHVQGCQGRMLWSLVQAESRPRTHTDMLARGLAGPRALPSFHSCAPDSLGLCVSAPRHNLQVSQGVQRAHGV